MIRPTGIRQQISKHGVLLDVDSTISRDTEESSVRRILRDVMARKKAVFYTRPLGTSSRHQVSYGYFGCVAGVFGAVVAGFVPGVVGLAPLASARAAGTRALGC